MMAVKGLPFLNRFHPFTARENERRSYIEIPFSEFTVINETSETFARNKGCR